ncbi:thioesterase II family protein [Streptomyces sp. SBT349]|uniref:thioesterase II family protein n=1 Tax=Streptomyces sp. SBT349 TaxID=1580539 RepID=UPI00066B854D|nr:alpha/beta fold hydrolase [Streptomyces sp. SBT349]
MPPSAIRPLPRPHASRTLLCLSFCGGGTAPFRPWARSLPEDVELVLHCYPGREGRFTEPFAKDWRDMLDDALTALRGIARRPYVLFGHSMGAWAAFDLARRASAEGLPAPQSLALSAADSPALWRNATRHRPEPNDTDQQLIDWMCAKGQLPESILGDEGIMQIAVEILRADLGIMNSYRYGAGDRVEVPVQVLLGEDDSIGAEAPERWRLLNGGPLEATWLPGGHFYTPEVWARLPEYLTVLGRSPSAA